MSSFIPLGCIEESRPSDEHCACLLEVEQGDCEIFSRPLLDNVENGSKRVA
jgi:hypothetical protein